LRATRNNDRLSLPRTLQDGVRSKQANQTPSVSTCGLPSV